METDIKHIVKSVVRDLVENVYGEAEVANAEALSLDCAWRVGGAAGRRKTSLGDSKEKEQLRGNGRTPHSGQAPC